MRKPTVGHQIGAAPGGRLNRELTDEERRRRKAHRRAQWWAVRRIEMEIAIVWLKIQFWRLFNLPGDLLDLPDGHPYRFFAGQVIVFLGVVGLIAAVTLKRVPH